MIENIKQLTSLPVARTNIIKVNLSPKETIQRLLRTESNLYQIDFGYRSFKKERGETSQKFYQRLHTEVKNIIRNKLGLSAIQETKYELVRFKMGHYAFFFLNNVSTLVNQEKDELQSRIYEITAKLSESNDVNKLIEGLFSLRIKLALLEKTSDKFEIEASYFNSEIYLNSRYFPLKGANSGKGIIEAFRLSVYASEQNELAFSLHKSKFLVEGDKELRANLEDEPVWFNTSSERQNVSRKLDARDSKLVFFKDRSNYGESQAYTHNVVMNMVQNCLLESNIAYQDIAFQATHEVNGFSTDLDTLLSNRLYIIEAEACFSDRQRNCFKAYLQENIPECELIDKSKLNELITTHQKNSILVLNPIISNASNSICEIGSKSSDEFSGFWQAFEKNKKKPTKNWDLYTKLKIQRLDSWLEGVPQSVPLQGMNVDKNLLSELDYIDKLKIHSPTQFKQDLSNPKSKLSKCLSHLGTKFKRVKTELWFKESLLTSKEITPFPREKGHYTAFYFRSPKYSTDMLVGHVEISLCGEHAKIITSGVNSGDDEWVKMEHPELERVTKFFDNSFYLYDHDNDVLLTSYTSGRIPKVIGPASFDSVEWYLHQEEEKQSAEREGNDYKDYVITRTYKAEKNVLPYYLVQGRSKSDPLAKSNKLKHHRIYLMPHKEGLYYLVTHSQPANATIAKQNLIENIIIWDANGQEVEPFNHPLTSAFLNSFTLDMLKSGESSKSSMFIKLAKLLIEN